MNKILDLEGQLFNRNADSLNISDTNQSCFPSLSYKERIIAFVIFNVLGYIVQLGSFLRFISAVAGGDPAKFAMVYTLGNVLALCGTLFLVGIKQQIKMASNPTRRLVSLIFFGSLILCIVTPLVMKNKGGKVLTFIFVFVQMGSYWWYTLSYIPGARFIARNCLSCLKNAF